MEIVPDTLRLLRKRVCCCFIQIDPSSSAVLPVFLHLIQHALDGSVVERPSSYAELNPLTEIDEGIKSGVAGADIIQDIAGLIW